MAFGATPPSSLQRNTKTGYGHYPNHYILTDMVRWSLFLVVFALAVFPARAGGAADADAGVARLTSGDARTAIDLFTRAIQSKDLSQDSLALTYHRRGMAFYMDGEVGRAILDYTIALWHEDLPKDFRPRTLNNRGLAFEAIGDFDSALRDYGLSIRLNPGYGEPYANRGNLYRKFQRHAEAISDYDMALKSGHPHPKYVFAWQGISFEALDRRREAMDDFRRALSIDPGFEMAKSRLSKLEQSQDLNGILGRKKVQRGTGGPLLTSAPLGTKADAMSMEPASQATPWLPPTAKVPSISSLPEGADDAGNEMGLRPALQEEAPVSSGRSHVPNKISMSPVDPGRTGRGGGDTQYALQLGSFSSAELAETAWNRASRISEAQLSGMSHSIEAYSQPDGRSLFRLFAGALPDRRTALSLCSVLREKGATCIVVRR